MNLIKYKNWFFTLSLVVIMPGIFALFVWGLKLGIDFAGCTLWEIEFSDKEISTQTLQTFLEEENVKVTQVTKTGQQTMLVKMFTTDDEEIVKIKQNVGKNVGEYQDLRLETVGPTVSRELTQKAFAAVSLSILAILAYITWAFRKIPKPTSSLSFGICTIIALVHDVIVVVGIFSILGHFLKIEIDSLFITALLTVIGFSVHDTIVVFDRIRENLIKYSEAPFEQVVNHSLVQTLGRSLNTSLTAVFVLAALFLFGGHSIKNFVLALLVGIISGTYSSIFNAAPLLVVWQNLRKKYKY